MVIVVIILSRDYGPDPICLSLGNILKSLILNHCFVAIAGFFKISDVNRKNRNIGEQWF
jgi:hypothetical protein